MEIPPVGIGLGFTFANVRHPLRRRIDVALQRLVVPVRSPLADVYLTRFRPEFRQEQTQTHLAEAPTLLDTPRRAERQVATSSRLPPDSNGLELSRIQPRTRSMRCFLPLGLCRESGQTRGQRAGVPLLSLAWPRSIRILVFPGSVRGMSIPSRFRPLVGPLRALCSWRRRIHAEINAGSCRSGPTKSGRLTECGP
jgi:hypothetical protein